LPHHPANGAAAAATSRKEDESREERRVERLPYGAKEIGRQDPVWSDKAGLIAIFVDLM